MTLKESISNYIKDKPFLVEVINDDLINISALARKMKNEIEISLGKKLNENAIIMALNRLETNEFYQIKKAFKNAAKKIGDITVKSGLAVITVQNSNNAIQQISQLFKEINQDYCSLSRGVNETTLVVEKNAINRISNILREGNQLNYIENLSSVSIYLPEGNSDIPGLYYFILSKMAWKNISIIEIISTTNEFTLVLNNDDVGDALKTLMELKL